MKPSLSEVPGPTSSLEVASSHCSTGQATRRSHAPACSNLSRVASSSSLYRRLDGFVLVVRHTSPPGEREDGVGEGQERGGAVARLSPSCSHPQGWRSFSFVPRPAFPLSKPLGLIDFLPRNTLCFFSLMAYVPFKVQVSFTPAITG